jgi:hypothetical protein
MNYEVAAEKYLMLRTQIEAMEKEHKAAKAQLTEKMLMLEQWITLRAQEEGLKTVPTAVGTAYWSEHAQATVASRDALFDYCKQNDTWDLLESRASKTAVKSFVAAHGEPPPGVNYGTIRVFNLRKSQTKKEV